MDNNISNKSTKEEVAEFFKNQFRVNEDVSNNFIKEYISGDILPILSDYDFKSVLGLKLVPLKRWRKYYYENEDKFKEEEIKAEISQDSSSEEVKKFLESYLDFKDNYNLDGKILFRLNEKDMKKLGMKLGQRKKLIKYTKVITRESSEKEVANFLMKELKLDGESLFEIEVDDLEEFDIPNSEKERLKNFIENIEKFYHLNIFMIICLKENYLKDKNISFYFMKGNDKKIFCEYKILSQSKSDQIYKNQICDLFLIKIDFNDIADKLYINMKNEKNEENNGYIPC